VAGSAGLLAAEDAAADDAHAAGPPQHAAVWEFPDRWSKESLGLAELWRRAGGTTAPLALDRSPLKQPGKPTLIAFGSFVNNDEAYRDYIKRFAAELQRFVERGGVVLEMTQSDQFGPRVSYLPPPMAAERGDRDLDRVIALAPEHPLVAPLSPDVATGEVPSLERTNTNWESFERWQGMRVLLSSEPQGAAPCLLEGAHGAGRFVVSSLWLDKCFDAQGQPCVSPRALEISERFFAGAYAYVGLVQAGKAPEVVPTTPPAPPATGPLLGHVDQRRARVWYRPSPAHHGLQTWRCRVERDGRPIAEDVQTLDADHDYTLLFEVAGLEPQVAYEYYLEAADDSATVAGPFPLLSAPAHETPCRIVLGMGSCAPSDPNHVWDQIVAEGCAGFVFLGDTPYIDSSDLQVAREKHRQFLAQPQIARMIARMPCWGTWDDHDFGRNDGHGDFPGKHIARIAFTEYRANATFGHDEHGAPQPDRYGAGRGVYTSFRWGPLEVFLIDPRWFSRTAPSWADPSQPTCIGGAQWAWLQRGLKESTAPFKALATGTIWDDKQNSEKDDWHTYRYEREAIFDFIRDERIEGCFLIGGDIHVSRALNYGPRVGYDLWQMIVSPLHGGTIPSLNVPHPSLVHHAVEPYVFLRLEIDGTASPETLCATWINRDGKRIFEVSFDRAQLSFPA
jgi:phosphodiesterase/alkaline phosphatase D-like protein